MMLRGQCREPLSNIDGRPRYSSAEDEFDLVDRRRLTLTSVKRKIKLKVTEERLSHSSALWAGETGDDNQEETEDGSKIEYYWPVAVAIAPGSSLVGWATYRPGIVLQAIAPARPDGTGEESGVSFEAGQATIIDWQRGPFTRIQFITDDQLVAAGWS
eukprot:GHVN01069390.1.p1 GENE.GHVN01069390.1~~GHVN01069390.1.p1  ORF type:complete len:158 (+),score=18.82 GHVN01069390.1:659-1132(+)